MDFRAILLEKMAVSEGNTPPKPDAHPLPYPEIPLWTLRGPEDNAPSLRRLGYGFSSQTRRIHTTKRRPTRAEPVEWLLHLPSLTDEETLDLYSFFRLCNVDSADLIGLETRAVPWALLQKAYRNVAKAHHPDATSRGQAETFILASEIYRRLERSKARRRKPAAGTANSE
jgi:hypothetical protein